MLLASLKGKKSLLSNVILVRVDGTTAGPGPLMLYHKSAVGTGLFGASLPAIAAELLEKTLQVKLCPWVLHLTCSPCELPVHVGLWMQTEK